MKNILLPTDFSENSWNAIKYAISFFKNQDCNFYLLHIKPIPTIEFNDDPLIMIQSDIDAHIFKFKKLLTPNGTRIFDQLFIPSLKKTFLLMAYARTLKKSK